MLKLIPTEIEAGEKKQGRYGQPGPAHKKHKAPPNPKSQRQCYVEVMDQNGKLKKVCIKFVRFVKEPEGHSIKEIGEMIHNLQEGIICLEKKRRKVIWKKTGHKLNR